MLVRSGTGELRPEPALYFEPAVLPQRPCAPRHSPFAVYNRREVLQLVVHLGDEPVLALLGVAQRGCVIGCSQVRGQNFIERLALVAELLHLSQDVDEHGAVAQQILLSDQRSVAWDERGSGARKLLNEVNSLDHAFDGSAV